MVAGKRWKELEKKYQRESMKTRPRVTREKRKENCYLEKP